MQKLSPLLLRRLMAGIRRGLEEGGLGVGTGIAYVAGADHNEIYKMFETAAAFKYTPRLHGASESGGGGGGGAGGVDRGDGDGDGGEDGVVEGVVVGPAPCFIHARGSFSDLSDFHELFADAAASGCPLQICHIASSVGPVSVVSACMSSERVSVASHVGHGMAAGEPAHSGWPGRLLHFAAWAPAPATCMCGFSRPIRQSTIQRPVLCSPLLA